jgi:ubiquinone/menaquinone biosynthesis C-methylase UbiE
LLVSLRTYTESRNFTMALDRNADNTYLNDPESGGEMARLLDQDHMLTMSMGGLLPELSGIEAFQRVLDIACGPGGWPQEFAFSYPESEVVGIDISRAMIAYARMQASTRQLANAQFKEMDVTKPLAFPDADFDLVNARTLEGFMLTSDWPKLLQECVRILRPGGVLRVVETDLWGQTNSPAYELMEGIVVRAAALSGHSFDPSGKTYGVTPVLEGLFTQAGIEGIRKKAYTVTFSAGSMAYNAMYQNCRFFFKLVQPFLLRTRDTFPEAGIPAQEELDRIYEQVLIEMLAEDFEGVLPLLTVWGTKPNPPVLAT